MRQPSLSLQARKSIDFPVTRGPARHRILADERPLCPGRSEVDQRWSNTTPVVVFTVKPTDTWNNFHFSLKEEPPAEDCISTQDMANIPVTYPSDSHWWFCRWFCRRRAEASLRSFPCSSPRWGEGGSGAALQRGPVMESSRSTSSQRAHFNPRGPSTHRARLGSALNPRYIPRRPPG